MKISKQAIKHPMGVIFAALGIFIASLAAYFTLPLELVPRIEIPYAFVSATYIGAAPSEVETEIIKPIEDKLAQLQDVEDVTGYAMQNVGFITIKFSADADLKLIHADGTGNAIAFKRTDATGENAVLVLVNLSDANSTDVVWLPEDFEVSPDLIDLLSDAAVTPEVKNGMCC